MKRRRTDPRRAKLHRSYTVEEAAYVYGVHKNTVRAWQKTGLKAIDGRRPAMFLGEELRLFLRERRARRKRPTPPGMIYCLGCREPRPPAGNMVDYISRTPTSGDFKGICPVCESMIYRRINFARIKEVRGTLDVTFTQQRPRITDCAEPSPNHDSDTPAATNADA